MDLSIVVPAYNEERRLGPTLAGWTEWMDGFDDPQRALAMAGGVLLGLGHLLTNDLTRDDGRTADAVTEDLLVLFGMPADDAHDVCTRPLPRI